MEAADRDDLRRDRHKERERDRRIKRANPGKAEKMRSMEDRDITEKIALGQAAPGQAELYDQRLFNASAGLDSGLFTSACLVSLRLLFRGRSSLQITLEWVRQLEVTMYACIIVPYG